jgi:hypothetical protein
METIFLSGQDFLIRKAHKIEKAAHGGMSRPFTDWKRKNIGGTIMHQSLSTLSLFITATL